MGDDIPLTFASRRGFMWTTDFEEASDNIDAAKCPEPSKFDTFEQFERAYLEWGRMTRSNLQHCVLPVPLSAWYRGPAPPLMVPQEDRMRSGPEQKRALKELELERHQLMPDNYMPMLEMVHDGQVGTVLEADPFPCRDIAGHQIEVGKHIVCPDDPMVFGQFMVQMPLPYMYRTYDQYEMAMNEWSYEVTTYLNMPLHPECVGSKDNLTLSCIAADEPHKQKSIRPAIIDWSAGFLGGVNDDLGDAVLMKPQNAMPPRGLDFSNLEIGAVDETDLVTLVKRTLNSSLCFREQVIDKVMMRLEKMDEAGRVSILKDGEFWYCLAKLLNERMSSKRKIYEWDMELVTTPDRDQEWQKLRVLWQQTFTGCYNAARMVSYFMIAEAYIKEKVKPKESVGILKDINDAIKSVNKLWTGPLCLYQYHIFAVSLTEASCEQIVDIAEIIANIVLVYEKVDDNVKRVAKRLDWLALLANIYDFDPKHGRRIWKHIRKTKDLAQVIMPHLLQFLCGSVDISSTKKNIESYCGLSAEHTTTLWKYIQKSPDVARITMPRIFNLPSSTPDSSSVVSSLVMSLTAYSEPFVYTLADLLMGSLQIRVKSPVLSQDFVQAVCDLASQTDRVCYFRLMKAMFRYVTVKSRSWAPMQKTLLNSVRSQLINWTTHRALKLEAMHQLIVGRLCRDIHDFHVLDFLYEWVQNPPDGNHEIAINSWGILTEVLFNNLKYREYVFSSKKEDLLSIIRLAARTDGDKYICYHVFAFLLEIVGNDETKVLKPNNIWDRIIPDRIGLTERVFKRINFHFGELVIPNRFYVKGVVGRVLDMKET